MMANERDRIIATFKEFGNAGLELEKEEIPEILKIFGVVIEEDDDFGESIMCFVHGSKLEIAMMAEKFLGFKQNSRFMDDFMDEVFQYKK